MEGRKEQREQGKSYLWGEKTRKVGPCLLAINELNHHQQKKEKPWNRRTSEDMA
jgi:hypothetical protein